MYSRSYASLSLFLTSIFLLPLRSFSTNSPSFFHPHVARAPLSPFLYPSLFLRARERHDLHLLSLPLSFTRQELFLLPWFRMHRIHTARSIPLFNIVHLTSRMKLTWTLTNVPSTSEYSFGVRSFPNRCRYQSSCPRNRNYSFLRLYVLMLPL